MKICISCKAEKQTTEYYVHPQMKDGRLGVCKECHRARMNKRRTEKLALIQAYDRERGQLEHRKEANKKRAPRYMGMKAEYLKDYRRKHPSKNRARCIVFKAIRNKLIVRPSQCDICEIDCVPDAHHHDYSKPLDVAWLCRPCHGFVTRIDNEITRQKNAPK